MRPLVAALILAAWSETALAQSQAIPNAVFDPNPALQSLPGMTLAPMQQQYQGSLQFPPGAMQYEGGTSWPLQGGPPWYQTLPAAGGNGTATTMPMINMGQDRAFNNNNWISPAPRFSPPPPQK